MTCKKHPSDPHTYSFEDQGQPFGEMRFDASLSHADCTFGDLSFRINKKGFWSNSPQIVLPDHSVALFAKSKNWFSTTETLYGGTKNFHIGWQNKPLAELIIFETDRQYPLLAIGLKTEAGYGITRFQVTDVARRLPEFPYLLAYAWSIFLPVSMQGMDDETLMLVLAAAS